MRYLHFISIRLVVIGLIVAVAGGAHAAALNYAGTHYASSPTETFFPKYSFPQGSIVQWRSDNSKNVFSARQTATGRYYGVDGWALFGTSFGFPDANTFPGNHDYLNINHPDFPNLEERPYFISNTQIVAHEKGGGDAAALIDDPRTQWGGRWWTFDGVNYPPPNGSNTTGVVPYLKTGFIHGWDEFGHDPTQGPAGRYAFLVGENAPKRFRVGVMTDGLARTGLAPEEVYMLQMDVNDPFFNTVLEVSTTGSIPFAPGGNDRFIDMHFFDIVDAQPGDLFLVAARARAGDVHAAINGISFDVLKDPGDYNADGVVNAADYTVWRNSLGEGVKAGARADGNNSSEIDAGDYEVWKQNFGHVSSGAGEGSTGLAAPEPASVLSACFAALFGLFGCRRR